MTTKIETPVINSSELDLYCYNNEYCDYHNLILTKMDYVHKGMISPNGIKFILNDNETSFSNMVLVPSIFLILYKYTKKDREAYGNSSNIIEAINNIKIISEYGKRYNYTKYGKSSLKSKTYGQYRLAKKGNNSLSFVINSNHVFTSFYDSATEKGVKKLNPINFEN
ncbi:hypothetical protein PIROE2DRAFT_2248 [Piromyces sp. E2]|nr:hypothetical protein PIROE2DRAFT_2248 [Piromyces sp. E2]|eukprot:OUM69817.1 hypothetical protein PIROE2DRAFT_2248 [Piromyces sp. E2]